MDAIGDYLKSFGERLPQALQAERRSVVSALQATRQ